MKTTLRQAMTQAISNVLESMFFQSVRFPDTHCTLLEWFPEDQSLSGSTFRLEIPKLINETALYRDKLADLKGDILLFETWDYQLAAGFLVK